MVLDPSETEAARSTPVWIVWWEDPERSWEALCLSEAESESEHKAREADHLIARWGKTGKGGRRSLLEWLEDHLRAAPASTDAYAGPAKEVLRRLAAGEPGPVIVHTW